MRRSTVWRVATHPLVLGAVVFISFVLVVLFALALILASQVLGPAPRPDTVVAPDVAGPAGQCPHCDGCTVSVWGHSVDIRPDAVELEYGYSGAENLLLYGDDDGLQWYVFLPILTQRRDGHETAVIRDGFDAWDDGDGVIFAFRSEDGKTMMGVRLLKADGWESGHPVRPDADGHYPWWYSWYLDLRGRLVDARATGGA